MAAHKTNSLLRYAVTAVILIVLASVFIKMLHKGDHKNPLQKLSMQKKSKNGASNDSAAESLDTLTAELAVTKQQVTQITQDNTALKSQNADILKKLQGSEDSTTSSLSEEVEQLKEQVRSFGSGNSAVNNANISQPIMTVPDLTDAKKSAYAISNPLHPYNNIQQNNQNTENKHNKPIPYYTIPANATAVKDKLMTALVGRIPIKGVVTDPYPFKIVFSDDTLAANGLRVPHLKQMIVSGYAEGDLNLVSVRGWVTSLTFVFDDGTISSTTSNDNNIGHYTKENAIGFLSDPRGNPFIRGKLITNAPSYLTGNILLSAGQGAASAYAKMQTTDQTSAFGTSSSSVTGSPWKYVLGQSGVNSANEAQQWWHDREESSFDAIYVPSGQNIVVNFAKQIDIDYNPKGRKLDYENASHSHIIRSLD